MQRLILSGLWLVVLVVFGIVSANAAENGVVAWYKFDEGKGDEVKDYSGNGNSGEIISDGKPIWVKEGPNGASLRCGGEEKNYVQIPWSDLWGMAKDDFMVEAWVKPDEVTVGGYNRHFIINAFIYGGGAGFEFEFDVLEGLGMWRIILGPALEGPNADYFQCATPEKSESNDFNDGKWHHLITGRTAKAVFIVVDGKEFRSGQTISADITPSTEGPINIGMSDLRDGFIFNGLIGEVKLWKFDGKKGRPKALNFEPKTLYRGWDTY